MEEKLGYEGGYSIPRTAPLYESPPYEYQDVWSMIILFKTTSDALKDMVPEPLVPNPDNLMFIWMGRMNATGIGAYNEVILAVPSTLGDITGNYATYLYLDKDAPIACGREIWGWPKKQARITFAEDVGLLISSVERGGVVLIKAALERSVLKKPEDLQLNPTWLNLKLIPSVKREARPDVAQLTSNTLDNVKIKQAFEGKATLEFGMSPADPLYKIPIEDVLGGNYINLDFTLTYGDIIHDYLTAGRQ